MGANTKIEWAHHTFNPWLGCTKVSPGCDNCYAENDTPCRVFQVKWGNHPRRRTAPSTWREPITWNRKAQKLGERQRVFCASDADVFDNQAPEEWRADLFNLIRATLALDWLLLTKRPQNIEKMLPPDWGDGYPNVWLGTTTENQEEYARRWPILAGIPATLRFIPYEPALSDLTVTPADGVYPDWIICGGETGRGARLMDPAWARQLRNQCRGLGIPFFVKQMTSKAPIPADLMVRQFPR
jgi:protein gp37